MEIVYELVVGLKEDHLTYKDKNIKAIEKEIFNFSEKYGKAYFEIKVEITETENPGLKPVKRHYRKAVVARSEKKPVHHRGRGRPKGWKKGQTFEEARQTTLPPEDE